MINPVELAGFVLSLASGHSELATVWLCLLE